MGPALAQQRADGEATVQLRERGRQVDHAIALAAHVLDLCAARRQARLGVGHQHHAGLRLGQQRDVRGQRQAPGDDARQRLVAQAALAALAAPGLLGHDSPVALGLDRSRADHDRVHDPAQPVEQQAVGAVSERPRATGDAHAAVGGAHHVEHHVRAPARTRTPFAHHEVLDDLIDCGGVARRQQAPEHGCLLLRGLKARVRLRAHPLAP